jgi:benzodiazapine receptor
MTTASLPPIADHSRHPWWGLGAWMVFCFSASATAVFVSTGSWYAGVHKPAWNPPNWVFGPVWTTLYLMMALAAWLVWRDGGWQRRAVPLGLFVLQWVLNTAWTPLFFGLHRPGVAAVDIALLWVVLITTLILFWRTDKRAGGLMIPYLAWVTFAAVLNVTICRLNP